jgi:hypothetical protein
MSELQQNARRNDAGEKDGDDSAMKSALGALPFAISMPSRMVLPVISS